MPTHRPDLSGKCILIAEDDPFIADGLSLELQGLGALVVGPVDSQQAAIKIFSEGLSIDGVVLNPTLRGEKTFTLASLLKQRNVPLVFVVGGHYEFVPHEFFDVPMCSLPVSPAALVRALFPSCDWIVATPGGS